MQKCPNCGQGTARTEDWACQWCGYPLLSGSYKKIPQTYKELKEERLREQESLVSEEDEVLETELEPEPVAVLEPEPVVEPEPEPVIAPEAKPAAKAKPKARAKAKPKPKSKAKPRAAAEAEPEASVEAKPEAAADIIEVTVEELLSAYETDGVAADARFAGKVLEVTGIANRIEVKDMLDIYYIFLTSGEAKPLQNVRCEFYRTQAAALKKLTAGQTVAVQGTYDGSVINIRMRDCVLVH
ncbi:hypothetical protein ACFLXU_05030 [Chloroflexota bacterium]